MIKEDMKVERKKEEKGVRMRGGMILGEDKKK